MTIYPEELPHLGALSQREQARDRLRELILRGKLSSKGYIPSIRKTAEMVGLNRDAVWRAFIDLEKEGYIRSTANKRYEIHPSFKNSHLRPLDVRLITVGEDSIRFSGLQRFHKALVEKESLYRIRPHLKCVVDASNIKPEWLKGMDGLILAGYFDHSELIDSVTSGIPRIGVTTSQDWNPDIWIDTDNRLAGELAASHLIEVGAQSPCILAYAETDTRHTLRKLGFQTKWMESGRSLDKVSEHWIKPFNTYQRVVELERAARDLGECDSAFCLDSNSAIDLLNILDHRNIGVPSTIKVVSVDGTFEGLKTRPTLTYVKQRFRNMAAIAAEKMRLLCSPGDTNAKRPTAEKIFVAPELVIRESA